MAEEKQEGVPMVALKTFDHNDGRRLTKDVEFLAATEQDAGAYEAKQLAVRGGSGKKGMQAPEPEDEGGVGEGGEQKPTLKQLEKDWPLAQDPETYLSAHPEGPNAKTARQIVAARKAAEKSEKK